jgi:hypothetical protein
MVTATICRLCENSAIIDPTVAKILAHQAHPHHKRRANPYWCPAGGIRHKGQLYDPDHLCRPRAGTAPRAFRLNPHQDWTVIVLYNRGRIGPSFVDFVDRVTLNVSGLVGSGDPRPSLVHLRSNGKSARRTANKSSCVKRTRAGTSSGCGPTRTDTASIPYEIETTQNTVANPNRQLS